MTMAGAGRRAVVVEDDEQMRIIIRTVLEMLEITDIIEVGDGDAAVSALQGGNVDVVVMDWMMPGMNGFDCTRVIRSGAVVGLDPNVPIVMLTAVTGSAERRALEAGANIFLNKTASVRRLFAEIKGVLASSPHCP